MARVISLHGRVFGRLTVEKFAGIKHHHAYWKCWCECGESVVVASNHLRRGMTVSCGCYQRDITRKRCTTHGNRNHKLYNIWSGMNARCHNPNEAAYKDYGGRGLTVCPEWRSSFIPFFTWAEDKWRDGLTIDRIDNNQGYSPSNCRFVSMTVQALNRRRNSTNKSGVIGVYWSKQSKKWVATGRCNKKSYYLGKHEDKSEAIKARLAWEESHMRKFIERNSNHA